MRRLLPVLLVLLAACGAKDGATLAIGSSAPDFSLPGVDGKTHTLGEFASSQVLAVVFTCNHCPASQLYESRLKALHEDYRAKGVTLIAVNPDNPRSIALSELAYTDVGDSLADMKVRATHRRLEYPYLYDGESQALTAKFGVTATPQIFIFDRDRKLRYQGRIDDNSRETLVTTRDARGAIDALLGGRPVAVAQTAAAGCAIRSLSAGSARDDEMKKIEAEPVSVEMAQPPVLTTLRANGTDKLRLVNFWATWCGPCANEFPDLENTYRMYRGRHLEFVSVSANDPEEKSQVMAFLQKHHASSRNLLFATADTFGLQAAFDPLMPSAVPFTVVITPGGDIVYQELGELNILKLRRAILANLPDDSAHPGQQAYWAGP
ncbi:MAG: redoxin family protein [Acidobacteriota bacterium]